MSKYASYLPWFGLVGPGTMRQRDGSLLAAFRFRGVDIDCLSEFDRLALSETINDVFMRLGSAWGVHIEAQRVPCDLYPSGVQWPTAASHVFDLERARSFRRESEQLETLGYMTLTCRQPGHLRSRLTHFLVDDRSRTAPTAFARQLESFTKTISDLTSVLRTTMPLVEPLDDDALVTYLKSCISTRRQAVRADAVRQYVAELLPDEVLQPGFGLSMLGDHHVAVSTIDGSAVAMTSALSTRPQMLAELADMPFGLRMVTRWQPLDRPAAKNLLAAKEREHERSSKGWRTMLEQKLSGKQLGADDHQATERSKAAAQAQRVLDHRGYGRLLTSFVVLDRDREECLRKQLEIRKVVQGAGFVIRDETWDSFHAWLGTLPGNFDDGRPGVPMNTRQFADLLPINSVWSGDPYDAHLAKLTGVRRPHFTTTAKKTPYRGVLADGDVGHTGIFGKTGCGKSTLLAFLEMQFLGYPGARVIHLEIGRAGVAAAMANGGIVHELGDSVTSIGLQPLANVDDEEGRVLACEWLYLCCEMQGLTLTHQDKEAIDATVNDLARQPRHRRTLTRFNGQVGSRNPRIRDALRPYTHDGNYGRLFDGDSEPPIADQRWITFDLSSLMTKRDEVVIPALTCLLSAIERSLGNGPTMITIDEAWRFFKQKASLSWFERSIRTVRTKDGRFYFATQEMGSLVQLTELLITIRSACATQIFGYDPSVVDAKIARVYREGCGLTDKELEIVSRVCRPKTSYYIKTERGSRVVPLTLGPIQKALITLSSQSELEFLDTIRRTRKPEEYAEAMLAHRGLARAVQEVRSWNARQTKAA